MEQVWGRIVTENSVDQIISILRNYLEQNLSNHKLSLHSKNIEALSVLNKAKLIYHEGWTAQNQALLEKIKEALN